uniref:Protein SUPPRESSOR OF FRI 4-like isoform X1 n=1 Tax=Rhizophora mucronata TaxID=61149 RepID=A0A2P2K8V6_RHIMU
MKPLSTFCIFEKRGMLRRAIILHAIEAFSDVAHLYFMYTRSGSLIFDRKNSVSMGGPRLWFAWALHIWVKNLPPFILLLTQSCILL